jgi:DNA mismatch endonuclease (patch repair protein)
MRFDTIPLRVREAKEMVDIVEKSVRSRMMASIRGKNTKPEVMLRSYLHREGFRFRIHKKGLPGSPDIVLRKHGLVILVHGCFWHQHQGCKFASTPDDPSDEWKAKFQGTKERDIRNEKALRQLGWRVFVIWECGLTKGERRELNWLPERILDKNITILDWPPLHLPSNES